MKRFITIFIQCACVMTLSAQREQTLINDGWKFSLGHASDHQKDFTHGCEYFTYLAKAKAHNQNRGPAWPEFADSAWQTVNLPHDWVVDLPYSRTASHSHGYKTVGWKYPDTSVGWYRKRIDVPESWKGKHVYVKFDGIFRDAQVFCNGFYLGNEPSGYAGQVYDLTEYLDYGKENLLTVRADATMEEGWYYEGGGIYRDVNLIVTPGLHVSEWGVATVSNVNADGSADISIVTELKNDGGEASSYSVRHSLIDADGRIVASSAPAGGHLACKASRADSTLIHIDTPRLWDCDTPYLYSVRTEVTDGHGNTDTVDTPVGIRTIAFDENRGFLLNGNPVKLKGVNLHLDHAGVGIGVPDELWEYRIARLKELGVNAIRSSHNPASPSMLDICDREGILVIDENRLMGINDEHIRLLHNMIKRDRNHPSVILWSVGNEEWAIEWNDTGTRIATLMRDYCHLFDPSRPACVATSSGPKVILPVDVAGYNYISQNPVDRYRTEYPQRKALGTEETSGCGTRGVYHTDPAEGWMAAINRTGTKDGAVNVIERGWKFYDEREWLGGLFYWTGFDYRGEPNPMSYPATGSQFGILDYCGFPKDEAFYLKSWWTDTPTLHILPHWNLAGHEGEPIEIWAYTNCDEVRLNVNGKDLGKRKVPRNGHVSWDAVYKPGKIRATGYRNGKKILEEQIETTGAATKLVLTPHKTELQADGQDIIVVDMTMLDAKGRFVPDACIPLTARVDGPVDILGFGNGNPGFKQKERPAPGARTFDLSTFNGHAQLLLRSRRGETGHGSLSVTMPDGTTSAIALYATRR